MADLNYIFACAPAGTGLRNAVGKLSEESGITECVDIEKNICDGLLASFFLERVGFKDHPTMSDVTWYLSRNDVIKLWEDSAEKALHELTNSQKPNRFCLDT